MHSRCIPIAARLHLLYGKKPHVYRVIYEVDEKWRSVLVLAIRHGARRKLKPSVLV
jgi:mRNA-degrading endonuclease RelE of RelBE toxin-antitoxin system